MTESRHCGKRRWPCAGCGKIVITGAHIKIALCAKCRLLARTRKCTLCGEWFDPYIKPKRHYFELCPPCRGIYRRARGGYLVPLLGKPKRKAPRRDKVFAA